MSGRRRFPLAWLVVVPFFAYAAMFLFLPAGQVMVGAFKNDAGHWTFSNISQLVHDPVIRQAYENSIQLSLETAFFGALLGFLLAYAVTRDRIPGVVRPFFTTFSGVAANFGGIPLAFAFIATIGTIGIVTQFMKNQLGFDLYNWTPPGSSNTFTLFSSFGVAVVYLYFQIPLMLLVIAPAIDGLRREWREASSNLGASSWQFWRYVGIPVLLPSVMGAFILLFGNAFAAYATAYSLTSGGLGLVPILIGNDLTGNVYTNTHEGQALAFGMFVVLAGMMLIYIPLQRRVSRWAK